MKSHSQTTGEGPKVSMARYWATSTPPGKVEVILILAGSIRRQKRKVYLRYHNLKLYRDAFIVADTLIALLPK
jgi:hypothetical protein